MDGRIKDSLRPERSCNSGMTFHQCRKPGVGHDGHAHIRHGHNIMVECADGKAVQVDKIPGYFQRHHLAQIAVGAGNVATDPTVKKEQAAV